VKSLIINADDLGLSDPVNSAIGLLYDSSAITGSSIMPVARRFDGAVSMLKEKGVKDPGVHLTFTSGAEPVTGGVLFSSYPALMSRYFSGRLDLGWVRGEIRAQINKVAEQLFEPTHIDSHEHIHMLPGIFDIVLDAAREFNIPYVRVPVERSFVVKKDLTVKDLLRHWALKVFTPRARAAFSGKGLFSCDSFLGHFHAGRINTRTLKFFTDNIEDGITELAVHPAVMSRELIEDSPWHRNGQIEMEAIMSPEWKEELEKHGIELISHRQAIAMKA
jgi:chitin disaccharide deacetylase